MNRSVETLQTMARNKSPEFIDDITSSGHIPVMITDQLIDAKQSCQTVEVESEGPQIRVALNLLILEHAAVEKSVALIYWEHPTISRARVEHIHYDTTNQLV